MVGVPDTRRLAVVIPTYNRSARLRETVRGLYACERGGREVEIHVVDDASPDDTAAVAAQAASEAPAGVVIFYHRQEHAGSGAARNLGVRESRGDVVLFLDDDCVPESGWLRAIAEGPWSEGTAGLSGKIISAEQPGLVARYFRFLGYDENGRGPDGPLPVGQEVEICGGGNCAFRRDVLREVGGFEPLLGGGGVDMDLCWRIRQRGYSIRFQPEAVVRHHHKETLRGFLRTYWTQGYRGALRRALWRQRRLTWGRWAWDALRLPLALPRALLLPVDAARLARRGATPGDALVFAVLEWLRKTVHRCGILAMGWRILTGRQPLSWTAGSERPAPSAPRESAVGPERTEGKAHG